MLQFKLQLISYLHHTRPTLTDTIILYHDTRSLGRSAPLLLAPTEGGGGEGGTRNLIHIEEDYECCLYIPHHCLS